MRKAVPFLFYASRVLAICALLAELFLGLLAAFIGGGFVCFDNCPSPDLYFATLGPGSIRLMTPCVALEALALVTFLAYCAATRQPRRALVVVLVFLGIGLIGVFALNALLQHAQATLPVTPDGVLEERPLVTWAHQWGLALTTVAAVWSGVLAYLQWGRGVEWNPPEPL